MIYGITLLDFRHALIPCMGLKAPRLSKTTLYLSGEGDGSTLSIQGGSDVSVDFYQSLINAKDVAERICHKRFRTDIIVEQSKNVVSSGDSGGLMFSLALISMLERSPLNPMVTGTGRVDSDGNVHPVDNLREKAISVQQAGVKRFLVPYDQNFRMLPRGLKYIFVANVTEAWSYTKGK